MRKQYTEVLKSFFHKQVHNRRKALAISQEEMAHRLAMGCRSYVTLQCYKWVVIMKKNIYFCLVMSLLLVIGVFTVPCVEANGAQEDNMFQVDTLTSEPKLLLGFANYAISPSGCFAISGSHLTNSLIAVYDADGNYLYGYSINNPGSIAVSWVDDNIAVYFVRSNTIRVLDQNGTVLSEETSDDAMYNQLTSNTQIIDDTTYVAKHWFINHELLRWGSYTKLVRISNGEESVLWKGVPIFPIWCISIFGTGLIFLTTGIIIVSAQ